MGVTQGMKNGAGQQAAKKLFESMPSWMTASITLCVFTASVFFFVFGLKDGIEDNQQQLSNLDVSSAQRYKEFNIMIDNNTNKIDRVGERLHNIEIQQQVIMQKLEGETKVQEDFRRRTENSMQRQWELLRGLSTNQE